MGASLGGGPPSSSSSSCAACCRSCAFRTRTARHVGRRSTRRRSPWRLWTSPRPRRVSETRPGSEPPDDAAARDGVCSMHDQYSTLAWRLPGKSRLVRRQISLATQYEPLKCAGATPLTAWLTVPVHVFFSCRVFLLGVRGWDYRGYRSGSLIGQIFAKN